MKTTPSIFKSPLKNRNSLTHYQNLPIIYLTNNYGLIKITQVGEECLFFDIKKRLLFRSIAKLSLSKKTPYLTKKGLCLIKNPRGFLKHPCLSIRNSSGIYIDTISEEKNLFIQKKCFIRMLISIFILAKQGRKIFDFLKKQER